MKSDADSLQSPRVVKVFAAISLSISRTATSAIVCHTPTAAALTTSTHCRKISFNHTEQSLPTYVEWTML